MKSITALKIELLEKALSDLGCAVRATAPELMTTRRLNELITLAESVWSLVKYIKYEYSIDLPDDHPDATDSTCLDFDQEVHIGSKTVHIFLECAIDAIINRNALAQYLHPDATANVSFYFSDSPFRYDGYC
jgi:hypothetical protein